MRHLVYLAVTGVALTLASSLIRSYHNQSTSLSGSQLVIDGYGFPFPWRVTYAELPTLSWLAFVLDVYFFMLAAYVLVLVYRRLVAANRRKGTMSGAVVG